MLKVLNLKHVPGPIPDAEAVERVKVSLANARVDRIRVVLIVHGYGSGGVGGTNKLAIHAYLRAEQLSARIRTFIPGERLTLGVQRDLQRRYAGHRFTQLESHIRSRNEGVTLVEV
jgi:hypothetical protein